MTVGELIELLQAQDQTALVLVRGEDRTCGTCGRKSLGSMLVPVLSTGRVEDRYAGNKKKARTEFLGPYDAGSEADDDDLFSAVILDGARS